MADDSQGADGSGGTRRTTPRQEALRKVLFGGVYGTVLASALASALGNDGGEPDPRYDAFWILGAALAAAAAHGYAHAIAGSTAGGPGMTGSTVRSVLREWPLAAAALPTVAALFGSVAGWWSEDGAIDVALTINTAALFGWGVWAARLAGRRWAPACRVGGAALLLGLLIVLVNALSH